MTKATQTITISPPNFGRAKFKIRGTAPLVIRRFSQKSKQQIADKMSGEISAGARKKREPVDFDNLFNEARYVSPKGWDGFHAAAIRKAMISACRLCGFKMTLAKLSIFVVEDGWDKDEPFIPLVRIYAKPTKLETTARVATGEPYVVARPAYYDWYSDITIKWDQDQFTLSDVTNLLMRVGEQCGICEGRPDSPKSAGMGWGVFTIEQDGKEKH